MRKLLLTCMLLSFIDCINAQVVENPIFDRTDVFTFRVKKVEVKKDTTYVYCSYSAEEHSWANISDKTYIENVRNGERFQILKVSGIPFGPEKRHFTDAEEVGVVLYFPHVSTDKINIIEAENEEAFNIYGIDLTRSYKSSYTSADIHNFFEASLQKEENGDWISALNFSHKQLEATNYVEGIRSYASACSMYNMMMDLFQLKNYEKEIEWGLKAIDILRELPHDSIYLDVLARTYGNVGKAYFLLKEYEVAPKYLELSLATRRLKDGVGTLNYEEYLIYLKAISVCYRELSDTTNYIINSEEILKTLNNKVFSESERYIDFLDEILSVSEYYYNKKRFDDVIRIQERLIDVYHKHIGKFNDHTENAATIIANCYFSKKEYTKAIDWLLEVIEIQKTIRGINCESYLYSILILASYFEEIQDFRTSLKYNKEAASIAHNIYSINDLKYADVLSILSKSFYKNGDYKKAIENEESALEIRKNILGVSHNDYWISLSNLSTYYFSNGNIELSLETALKVVNHSYSQNERALIIALNNLAAKYSETIPQKAIDIELKATSLLDSLDSCDDLYWTCFCNLSELYFKNADYDNSVKSMIKALKYAKNCINNEYFDLAQENKYYYWDKFWLYFYRVFPYLVCKSQNSTFYGEMYNTSALFPKIVSNHPNKKSRNRSFEQNDSLMVDWKSIQRMLKTDEAAIEFLSFSQDKTIWYYALVLKKNDEFPHLVKIATEDAICKASLNKLYSIIWEPIIPLLSQVKSVYFSPVGVLDILNIECLMTNNYNIFRLTSTALLLNNKKDTRIEKNAVLYGGLTYEINDTTKTSKDRQGFDYLPNTLLEINDIEEILKNNNYKTILFSSSSGTEDSFKNLSGKSIEILHVATHSLYIRENDANEIKDINNFSFIQTDNDYKNTPDLKKLSCVGLVMSNGNLLPYRKIINKSDGILTGVEISQMDFHNVDIVVLSACETGLGDFSHENIAGLQMSFKKAGVNTILMSLRKVDDEATRIFMVEFYRYLLNGYTKSQSLQNAQQYLRKVDNGKYNDPKYWASFIMLDGLN